MKKIIYIFCTFCIALLSSCEKDDFTGDSKLTPTNPTISITGMPVGANLIEQDFNYTFDVTLSEPQIVDIAVYIKQTGGTATEGEDFVIDNGNSRVFIPAGRTTGKVSISIKPDEIVEDTETFTIEVGDDRTANGAITPVSVDFTIQNVTEGDLALEFSWGAELFDAEGHAIPATDIADLILLITDENGIVLDGVDGTGFEQYLMEDDDYPDGTYYVKADVYALVDLGDVGELPFLDANIMFAQVGKIDATTFSFPAKFPPAEAACSLDRFILAKIVKTGTTYVVTKGPGVPIKDASSYLNEYDCDEPGYGVYSVNFTQGSASNIIINDNFWDSGFEVAYVFDNCGNVTIPTQVITAFGIPFRITGSGTYDEGDKSMVVDYKIVNDTSPTTVYDDNTHTFTLP